MLLCVNFNFNSISALHTTVIMYITDNTTTQSINRILTLV